jgi:hypothetical protein
VATNYGREGENSRWSRRGTGGCVGGSAVGRSFRAVALDYPVYIIPLDETDVDCACAGAVRSATEWRRVKVGETADPLSRVNSTSLFVLKAWRTYMVSNLAGRSCKEINDRNWPYLTNVKKAVSAFNHRVDEGHDSTPHGS